MPSLDSVGPSSGTSTRALAVVSHPDDETIFIGGTLLSHPEYHWQILCVTYEQASQRAEEAMAAISCYRADGLQIGIRFLEHVDDNHSESGGIDITRLREQLSEWATWADLVVTHNEEGEYGHAAHRAVHRATKAIFSKSWEIMCNDSLVLPHLARSEYWYCELPHDIMARKRLIFEQAYPSQQLLWSKVPHLVGWAFNRQIEVFGRI